jgi:hypothetical protein
LFTRKSNRDAIGQARKRLNHRDFVEELFANDKIGSFLGRLNNRLRAAELPQTLNAIAI